MFNLSDDDMSQDEVTVPAAADSENRVEGAVGGEHEEVNPGVF